MNPSIAPSRPLPFRVLFLLLLTLPALAQTARPPENGKTQILPEQFLRAYDPITVFFATDRGPAKGGPLDEPSGFLDISPKHPGEARWLDARTLQFLPTIPWPALARFQVKTADGARQLTTLMARPTSTQPAADSRDLDRIAEWILAFAQPIAIEDLAKMIRIDVRPQPGTENEVARTLGPSDFTISALERGKGDAASQYLLRLAHPIGFGNVALLQLQLCQDPAATDARLTYRYTTRPVFRVDAVGSGNMLLPVTAAGSRYNRDQAIDGGKGEASITVRFSDSPAALTLEQVKALIHFQPAVRDLRHELRGQELKLAFTPEREKTYQVGLTHVELHDKSGRKLQAFGPSEFYVFFGRAPAFVHWLQARGIVERYGPQQLPMEARDTQHLDVRIYKIDPTDTNFWPFPSEPVVVDEEERPAGPGEEPQPGRDYIVEHIRQLGTPLVSRILALGGKASSGARFGFDLQPLLAQAFGKDQPGTYLIGYRELGTSKQRYYARVQVTDLCLATVEEQSAVVFAVTSLRDGQPIAGAQVLVEGIEDGKPTTLIEGRTDATGLFRYDHEQASANDTWRIRIAKDGDTLVLDPEEPAPIFFDNHNSYAGGTWLNWLTEEPQTSKHDANLLCFIFPERPIYRPEEPVHLRGYLRERVDGSLVVPELEEGARLLINGPGGRQWTRPLELDQVGNFYQLFDEKDLPSGEYSVYVDVPSHGWQGYCGFRKEAYRIPRFEVDLDTADRVALDKKFEVRLRATYYAGGPVSGQDVSWRVSTMPYVPVMEGYSDFLFSSEERFATGPRDDLYQGRTSEAKTDDSGTATLALDPTKARDARPLRYVIEATVTGADAQTVSNTRAVIALPPFTLGLRLPRLFKQDPKLRADLLVLGIDGKPKAGQELQVRVFQRQWHSYLVESDFTTGKAKYVTDVVDLPLADETVKSTAGPLPYSFTAPGAGVYIVEVLSRDALGRLQKVKADTFVSGDEAVSWQKPKEQIFEVVWDKDAYDPGQTANLIIKSPFQQARALVIVEAPQANQYTWVDVKGGQGIFALPVSAAMTPSLPVHVQLIRGRIAAERDALLDLGKPIAKSASTTLKVNPKAFRAKIAVVHPSPMMPGSTMPLDLTMTDPDGAPLDGEATIWLVDRAVMALATEGPLNALTTFLPDHQAYCRLRDTRNDVFGELPDELFPGGDGALAKMAAGLFGETTVRRNFKTVPFYKANLPVRGGKLHVEIPLPDNLTDFSIRAVCTSGIERFGYARSVVSIRLPLIVQPALPRFVRPGDQFVAGGLGRVVDGAGGAARAELQVEGLKAVSESKRSLNLALNQPQQIYFPLVVATQAAAPGEPAKTVKVAIALKREADGAADAFELELPVRPDRDWESREQFSLTDKQKPLNLLEPAEPARAGTLSRELLLTSQPALIKMLAALDFNTNYPHACTEQRVSQLMPQLALRDLLGKVGRATKKDKLELAMKENLEYLAQVQRANGLFGFWPGKGAGYVGLTAYVTEFLVLAQKAGFEVKPAMLDKALKALEAALRSDYQGFLPQQSFEERALALHALALAGKFDKSYAFELAARAQMQSLSAEAMVLHTLLKQNLTSAEIATDLANDLHKSVIYGLAGGKEVYKGLQYRSKSFGGRILSSESKTLASVTRALYRKEPDNPRVRLLVDELVGLGQGDGWGDTSSNTAALLALGEVVTVAPRDAGQRFSLVQGDATSELDTASAVVVRSDSDKPGPGSLRYLSGTGAAPLAWMRLRYLPESGGATVKPLNQGFALSRELELYAKDGGAPTRTELAEGAVVDLSIGTVVEEHLRLVNPEDRVYVAIRVPFAAGLEPLNPNLANAPAEARSRGTTTLEPTYADYRDDQVTFYYDELPKGTYHFYFRTRATIEGDFTHPAARAELMYRQTVFGRGAGARVKVTKAP